MNRVTVYAGVTAVLDKHQLGVGWSNNVVVVQVNRRMKLLESHIHQECQELVITPVAEFVTQPAALLRLADASGPVHQTLKQLPDELFRRIIR